MREMLATISAIVLILSATVPGWSPAQVLSPGGRYDDAPIALVDEAALPRVPLVRFPAAPWAEARACLARQGVIAWGRDTLPPLMLVIPGAATMVVHDLTVDSLTGTTAVSPPLVAYALVHTNLVLVVGRYQHHRAVLRHEALHFLLWRTRRLPGHPVRYFLPCDTSYDLFNPVPAPPPMGS